MPFLSSQCRLLPLIPSEFSLVIFWSERCFGLGGATCLLPEVVPSESFRTENLPVLCYPDICASLRFMMFVYENGIP